MCVCVCVGSKLTRRKEKKEMGKDGDKKIGQRKVEI